MQDPSCDVRKYMPQNPGISGYAGYVMSNTITVPKFRQLCTTVPYRYPVTKWKKKGCCNRWGCWGCLKTEWKEGKTTTCSMVPAGLEEKVIAGIELSITAVMLFWL